MHDSSWMLESEKLIDRIADRFEAAWHSGGAASLEAHLAEAPEECHRVLFRELLAVELQIRRGRGKEPTAEEYTNRFPHREADIRVAFQLADEDETHEQATAETEPVWHSETPVNGLAELARSRCKSATPAQPDGSNEPAGRHFGRFRLLEQLGSGSFGTVWKARDTVLKRLVALKIPRSDQLCRRRAALLLQEARNVARVKHVGVAQVHDAGEVEGTPYIASEYIAGTSLREHLEHQRVPTRQAAEISLRVSDALHHAHELGIIHRDLKPSNILLDQHGTPYVTDFGLAKSDQLQGTAGQLIGTASYMAPEQAAGQSDQADGRSDIYSLGVILYEMLTGRRPFEGRHDELLETVQRVEPVRPRRRGSRVPRDLEAICLRCLQKASGDRYATAGELAEEFRRYLRGEPVRARPLALPVRLIRWARRRPAVAALILTTLMFLGAVGAISAVSYTHTAKALETAQTHLYFHRIVSASQAWRSNRVAQFNRLLEECPPRLRGWEWGYLKGLPGSATFVLEGAGGPVAFSPNGRLIATGGGGEWKLKLWDAETGQLLTQLGSHESHLSSLDFDRDGKRLLSAGGDDRTAILWDVGRRQKIGTFQGHTGPIHSARFLPGRERIVTASTDGALRVWDLEAQEEVFRIEHACIHIRSLAVSDDGRYIALSTGKREKAKIWVWNAQSQELLWNVPTSQRASALAFRPQSPRLAAAASRELIRVWNVESRQMVDAFPVVPIAPPALEFSADGRLIAATAWDNSVAVYDAVADQPLLALRGHAGRVCDIDFSPNGKLLAFGTRADRVYVHRTSTEQGTRVLRGHTSAVRSLAFVPRTPQLVSGGQDGTVRLWDIDRARQNRLLWDQTSQVHGVCCHPDGNTVAAVNKEGAVRAWHLDTGKAVCTFRGMAGRSHEITYNPSGSLLALTSTSGEVSLWDARTGRRSQEILLPEAVPVGIEYSPCGKWLAVAERNCTVHLFNAQNLSLNRTLTTDTCISGLAFAKDGTLAVSSMQAGVYFWNADTGELISKIAPSVRRRQTNLAFHPDGNRFALAVGGNSVTFWELRHKQRFLALREKTNVTGQLAFSPDGQYIASPAGDGSIRVWSSPGPPAVKVTQN